jgi:1-aminocyclopropane-1-carboxylate deaminase/D-cysteine desulfhydrase-like pyridoxal-dependent ACC family enzyme
VDANELIHELASICNVLTNLVYGAKHLKMDLAEVTKETSGTAERLRAVIGALRGE